MGAITKGLYQPKTQEFYKAVMARFLERLEFTATFGDTEWASSVIKYVEECCEDVMADKGCLFPCEK